MLAKNCSKTTAGARAANQEELMWRRYVYAGRHTRLCMYMPATIVMLGCCRWRTGMYALYMQEGPYRRMIDIDVEHRSTHADLMRKFLATPDTGGGAALKVQQVRAWCMTAPKVDIICRPPSYAAIICRPPFYGDRHQLQCSMRTAFSSGPW